jgi:hypothetical protein
MCFIFYFFPDHRRAHCRSVDIKSNGDVPRSVRSEQIGRSPDTAPIVFFFDTYPRSIRPATAEETVPRL